MPGTVQFTIGAQATCSDGPCGELRRVIVDPVAESVTHLVIEPAHRRDPGRLVPLGLVDAATGELRLSCTTAEFEQLDVAEESQLIASDNGYQGYGAGEVGYLPRYGLGGLSAPGLGLGVGVGTSGLGLAGADVPYTITYDTVPAGEVEIRRGDSVQATDGDIGKVQGLVIDPATGHVTHVLLQEGHLWGRKDVAIPVSAVASTSDGIRLSISKQGVQDLPPVDIRHPDRPIGSP
jgi:sporulation protein YlmC with PRC-barrel domain